MRVAVLTVSDSVSAGIREDISGDVLAALVRDSKILKTTSVTKLVVGDVLTEISQRLIELSQESDVILTTGGTGLSARDVTPEATETVIEKRCGGFETALHLRSLNATPLAALSRLCVGIRNKTLIVNLPGSPKAVKECFEVCETVLIHAFHLITDSTRNVASTHDKLQHGNVI